MVRSEVALVAACNLTRVDEVKIRGQDGEALGLERREGLVVFAIPLNQVINGLQFCFPRDIFSVQVQQLLQEHLCLL